MPNLMANRIMKAHIRPHLWKALFISIPLTLFFAAIPYHANSILPRSFSEGVDKTVIWERASIGLLILIVGVGLVLRTLEYKRSRWLAPSLRFEALQSPTYFWWRFVAISVAATIILFRLGFDQTEACTTSVLNPDIGGVGVLIVSTCQLFLSLPLCFLDA
jgi:hypothetical protein